MATQPQIAGAFERSPFRFGYDRGQPRFGRPMILNTQRYQRKRVLERISQCVEARVVWGRLPLILKGVVSFFLRGDDRTAKITATKQQKPSEY